MSQQSTTPPPPFPRGVLIAAALLVGFSLLVAGLGRATGLGRSEVPQAQLVESRQLQFEDRADGAVTVRDATSHEVVTVLPPGTNGFVRGVMRGLARERRLNQVTDDPPFQLRAWADGRLTLTDPATDRSIELGSFGITNLDSFAQFIGRSGAPS